MKKKHQKSKFCQKFEHFERYFSIVAVASLNTLSLRPKISFPVNPHILN